MPTTQANSGRTKGTLRKLSNRELRRITGTTKTLADMEGEAFCAFSILAERGQIDPAGKPFTWGTILKTYEIGPEYAVVEYVRDEQTWVEGRLTDPDLDAAPTFHGYVRGRDTHHGSSTLDRAILECIAWAKLLDATGDVNVPANEASRMAENFLRMVGAPEARL